MYRLGQSRPHTTGTNRDVVPVAVSSFIPLPLQPENVALELDDFLHEGWLNNAVGWTTVMLMTGVLIESLLDMDVVWAGFTGLVMLVLLLPTVIGDDRRIRMPWGFLILASLPITARALDIGMVRGPIFFYLSFAALALIIAVEIHMYTGTKMTHWFAVVFVSLTTIAIEGAWAISRWYADSLLGTSFLPPHDDLMVDFVAVLAVGIGAGIFFDIYFRRFGPEVEP